MVVILNTMDTIQQEQPSSSNHNNLFILGIFVVVFFLGWMWRASYEKSGTSQEFPLIAKSFDECVAMGNAVMESYPRQCRDASGQSFMEQLGNESEKQDLIHLVTPRPQQIISSPLLIQGEARGWWFFEASFPIELKDANGNSIARSFAQAQDEWMAEGFVPFEAKLSFSPPVVGKSGFLILRRDNPSGLPEHDDALEIPVVFK